MGYVDVPLHKVALVRTYHWECRNGSSPQSPRLRHSHATCKTTYLAGEKKFFSLPNIVSPKSSLVMMTCPRITLKSFHPILLHAPWRSA